MSNNLTDLMTQKAIAEVEDVGDPMKAMAATGGLLAHLQKELPAEDFKKISDVCGMQADILIKKYAGTDAAEVWKAAGIDPANMKDWVHECTTMIRQATEVDVSKQLASIA
jgi:hypothetical protein